MIQMDTGDRLRVTLLDRMSTVENGRSSLTLEDVLMADTSVSRPQQPPLPSPPLLTLPESPARNRGLLDVMRRDRRRDKTTWKSLRDKLRLKRTSTAWISSNLIPSLDMPIRIRSPDNGSHRFNRLGFLLSNSETNRNSGEAEEVAEREGRLQLSTVLAEEREEVQLPRMSLMELLEDNDGPIYEVSEIGEVEEEGRMTTTTTTTTMVTTAESGCCVCMIRSKGAAFIPCGHTFCRLCSRELWVQRGNCPLCNTSILQVLDIF